MRAVCCVVAALWALPLAAQPAGVVEFNGTAHIGGVTRAVTIRFSCATDGAKINNLAIELDVPDAEALGATFDVNAFEGPSGIGGKHHLAGPRAQMEFGATGSYGNNGAPASTFTFSAAFPPGTTGLRKLQAVIRDLSAGGGHLVYTVANPSHGPSIEASADVDAATLKAATSRCAGH